MEPAGERQQAGRNVFGRQDSYEIFSRRKGVKDDDAGIIGHPFTDAFPITYKLDTHSSDRFSIYAHYPDAHLKIGGRLLASGPVGCGDQRGLYAILFLQMTWCLGLTGWRLGWVVLRR